MKILQSVRPDARMLAFALLFIALASTHASAQAPAPVSANPADWGIYAQLAGTTWNGTAGPAEWSWTSEGNVLEKRRGYMDQIITRGAKPGELIAEYGKGVGSATFDGRIEADGSVIWIRRGMIKNPMRAAVVDGRYREELVKLDGAGQVASVKNTGWYDQTGGFSAAMTTAAQPVATPAQAEAVAAKVADGNWGIYAQLAGTEWRGDQGKVSWQWGPDDTLVESRTMMMKTIIRQGAKPGDLVSVYGKGLVTSDGVVAADGSVVWIRRGILKLPQSVSIVDGRYREELVKVDDARQVVKGTVPHWYQQISGASPAIVAREGASAPAAPSSSMSSPGVSASFRGFERFLGKKLYSKDNSTVLAFSRTADGACEIKVARLDGAITWGYVLVESAKKPGEWEMVQNAYMNKYALSVRWHSNDRLALSSRKARFGGSANSHDLSIEGDAIKTHTAGIVEGDASTATYTETTDAVLAQLRADEERAAALAAQEQARLAAIAAQQQAEAQRRQKEAEAQAAALWLQRWTRLQEIAASDPYAAQAYANQHGLPYTNPLEPQQQPEEEWEDEPAKPAAWFQALQDMNAAASASEARSRAALDATMQQAARQAAYERQLAEQREQAAANARYAEQARLAREATERQYEIARQFEAQQEAQRQARAQAERAAAARAQPVASASTASPPNYAAERCGMVHPKVNDTYNTVKGEEFGRKYLRDRAEASCLSKTGNSGIDGDATCVAEGPYVWKCKILVQCAGTMRSPMCASSAQ